MIERDRSKRQVKPIDYKKLALLLSSDDISDDDEEYVPKGEEPEDIDIDDDDDESGDEDDGEDDSDEDDDDEDGSSLSDGEKETEEITEPKKSKKISKKSTSTKSTTTGGCKLAHILTSDHKDSNNFSITSPRKSVDLSSKISDIRICSVCCGDRSVDSDEIVECDSCAITVHENCYGVSGDDNDDDSIHSTVSSASTEPWFCDACKANVSMPSCELCPNAGGIFKQTDAGRWVHLVCALYTEGVTFADTIHLTGITLFELPYDRWGAKPCTLCEDDRFTRTGVTISCDAGLCRTYFHVTCAQREGLLQEVQEVDPDSEIVDPFVAHCKLHAVDKYTVKSKKRNFLSLQSRMKFKQGLRGPLQTRTVKKLENARSKWNKKHGLLTNIPMTAQLTRPFHHFLPLHVPLRKTPRLLSTSPAAVKMLVKKAELMGFTSSQSVHVHTISDIRKKWHVPPALSVEFVSYFIDRESRMKSMKKKLQELKTQEESLKKEEIDANKSMNDIIPIHDELKKKSIELRSNVKNLWTKLVEISTINHRNGTRGNNDKNLLLKMPSIFETPSKDRRHEPTSTAISPSKLAMDKTKKLKRKWSFSRTLSFSGGTHEFKLKECATCHTKKDQHLLAFCDSCRLHYHLSCLDPPLTRMPKKTRFGGWQCSDCTDRQRELQLKAVGGLIVVSNNEGDTVGEGSSPKAKRTRRGPDKYIPDADKSPAPPADPASTGTEGGTASDVKRRGRPRLSDEQKKRRMLAKMKIEKIKARRQQGQSLLATPNSGDKDPTTPKKSPVKKISYSPSAIRCPEPGCNKVYTHINGLKYHKVHAHGGKYRHEVDTTTNKMFRIKNEDSRSMSPTWIPGQRRDRVNSTSTQPKEQTVPLENSTMESWADETSKPSMPPPPTKPLNLSIKSEKVVEKECCKCQNTSTMKELVQCSGCELYYHFGCLDPPIKKSPKVRGYQWFCESCDSSEDEKHTKPQTKKKLKQNEIEDDGGKEKEMGNTIENGKVEHDDDLMSEVSDEGC